MEHIFDFVVIFLSKKYILVNKKTFIAVELHFKLTKVA